MMEPRIQTFGPSFRYVSGLSTPSANVSLSRCPFVLNYRASVLGVGFLEPRTIFQPVIVRHHTGMTQATRSSFAGLGAVSPRRGPTGPTESGELSVTKTTECPACGNTLGRYDQTCQKCGRALSYNPAEDHVGCAVCGAVIGAYAETCPECGETGYPALRPRKGRKFKGSPHVEAQGTEEE
jgi:predicted nucleic acid-binding Zn ribbon protein